MDAPTMLAALGAGACSLVSPGVVPLLPALLAFTRRRRAGHVIAFLVGSGAVFVLLGAGATGAGKWLLEHLSVLEMAAGVVLIALGLRATGLLNRSRRVGEHASQPETTATVLEAVIGGAALTFGWTPLAGVTLNEILAISTSQDTIALGTSLLVTYAAGRALSCLALALVLRAAVPDRLPGRWLDAIAGAVMMTTGLLIVTGTMRALAAALSTVLPLF
jgi:cytochrome c-type biogenesis protein